MTSTPYNLAAATRAQRTLHLLAGIANGRALARLDIAIMRANGHPA